MKKLLYTTLAVITLSLASCTHENNGIVKDSNKLYIDQRIPKREVHYHDHNKDGKIDQKVTYFNQSKPVCNEISIAPLGSNSFGWYTRKDGKEVAYNRESIFRKSNTGMRLQNEFDNVKRLYKN